MRPGPLRLSLENRTDRRVLPTLWIADDRLHHLLGRRRPFLTAKRLLTNQTFRDLYGTDTLDVDQRLKITSLTFLFTASRARPRSMNASAILRPTISSASIFACCTGSCPRKRARS
jgi:uncharacterized protein DUF5939